MHSIRSVRIVVFVKLPNLILGPFSVKMEKPRGILLDSHVVSINTTIFTNEYINVYIYVCVYTC
jgi:hypothetical protein